MMIISCLILHFRQTQKIVVKLHGSIFIFVVIQVCCKIYISFQLIFMFKVELFLQEILKRKIIKQTVLRFRARIQGSWNIYPSFFFFGGGGLTSDLK